MHRCPGQENVTPKYSLAASLMSQIEIPVTPLDLLQYPWVDFRVDSLSFNDKFQFWTTLLAYFESLSASSMDVDFLLNRQQDLLAIA